MNNDTLKRATARIIDGSGTTLGTGFLASLDGHVLTCWHVVKDHERLQASFEGAPEAVELEPCLELSNPDADVAVLQCVTRPPRLPAELDMEWRVGDDIWTYGYQYQEHFSAGYPLQGRISGDTSIKDQQLIVVSNTDVQRGLSGAPVLNTRTGKVVALVNAKFDDRGIGFAIPIATVTRHWEQLNRIIDKSRRRLRENSAELFKAMGYRIDLAHALSAGNVATFYAELAAGGTKLRTIVGCLNGSERIRDRDIDEAVHVLTATRARHRLDRIFLVTFGDYSAQSATLAREADVRLLSYTELEGSLIDFSEYLESIVHDYEHFHAYSDLSMLPVIEQFRWCDLYRYYIDLSAQDLLTGAAHGSVRALLDDFLTDPGQNNISVLGDYGTGKTTLCLQLAYELAKAHRADPLSRIPIFVPLRDLDLRTGIRRLIMDTLAGYGVRVADYAALDIMMKSGRFVLLLDGFDEAADRLDRRGVMQAFSQISQLTNRSAKVVLTCRTHYFRSESQSVELLTTKTMTPLMREIHANANFRVVELLKYDEAQIMELMSRHSANYRAQWQHMRQIYNLSDLAQTPILMNIILNSLEELLAVRARSNINSASLYDVYTKYWLERDDERSGITPEERLLFAEELAWRMYRDDRLSVPHAELSTMVLDFFQIRRERDREWLDRLDTNIRTCSFLARDMHGNYQFAHKSFMEFFVAKVYARRIDEWPRQDLLWPKAVPYEIGTFLSQLLTPEEVVKLKRYSVDRANNYFIRGFCMDIQMLLGDTVQDEPIVFSIAVSPDGTHVAVGHADRTVRIFTAGLAPVTTLTGHGEWVRTVAYSNDNRFLASGAWDNRVIIWSVPDYQIYRELTLPDRVNSVCFTIDSREIVCGGYDHDISVWNVETGQQTRLLTGHIDTVHGLTVDPRTGHIVSGGTDRTLRVWAPDRVWTEAQDEPIRCVAVSRDGRYMVTGSWTGDLIVWDTATLQPRWHNTEHTSMINSFSFTVDGAAFVSCSDDRTVRVWKTATGEQLAVLTGSDLMMGSAISPDGGNLYTGGYDSAVQSWSTANWVVKATAVIQAG